MTNQTETTKPEACDEAGGQVERVVGHKTFHDEHGFRHEPLLENEAKEIMARIEADDARRREIMPDEQAAIRMFFESWLRLKELGWREAVYCPKDGTWFDAIEPGSTGVHNCHYSGEWPKGRWLIAEHGDLYPSRPALFRERPNAEVTRLAEGESGGAQRSEG